MNLLAEISSEGWVTIITAAGAAIVSIIAAMKSSSAKAASDINSQRVTNLSQSQNMLRSDLTHVAAQVPPSNTSPAPQPWYQPPASDSTKKDDANQSSGQ